MCILGLAYIRRWWFACVYLSGVYTRVVCILQCCVYWSGVYVVFQMSLALVVLCFLRGHWLIFCSAVVVGFAEPVSPQNGW